MKFYTLSLAALIISLSFTSCKKGVFGICGKGDTVSESRSVTGFNKIDLSIDADVVYVQDSIYSVVVEAQSNILKVLETDVSGGTLGIDFRRGVLKHNKITVTVHSPDIYGLTISGSGKITAQSTVLTSSIDLKISGSGTIKLPNLTAETVDASISGSGDISVETGTVTNETFSISGSGSILTLDLVAQTADVRISGSGNAFLHVINELNVRISGSGNVSYKGQPVINTDISGSGNLIHL